MPLTKRGGWPYANPPNTSFELNRQSPQSRGLVGWWPTVGNRGSVLRDRSRHYDMAISGADATTDAEHGPVLDYVRTNSDYCQVSAAPVTTVPLTLTAWFWPDDFANEQCIVYAGQSDTNVRWFSMEFSANLAGDPIRAWERDVGAAATTVAPAAGAWNLGVAVFASHSSRTIYLNGGNAVTDVTAPGTAPTVQVVAIGGRRDSSPGQYFDGKIADVRMYNRALSAAEVWAMYDPATRWELYAPVISSGVVFVPGVSIPLFMHHYRQQRIGNGF